MKRSITVLETLWAYPVLIHLVDHNGLLDFGASVMGKVFKASLSEVGVCLRSESSGNSTQ